jgi:hypothetical protein
MWPWSIYGDAVASIKPPLGTNSCVDTVARCPRRCRGSFALDRELDKTGSFQELIRPLQLIAHTLTDREIAMKLARILSAGAAAALIVSSAALAQQMLTGTITGINRLNDTVAIQQTQSGTVGANTRGVGEEFKVQRGLSLEDLHAGDKVSFSVSETGGSRTVTKLQKQ